MAGLIVHMCEVLRLIGWFDCAHVRGVTFDWLVDCAHVRGVAFDWLVWHDILAYTEAHIPDVLVLREHPPNILQGLNVILHNQFRVYSHICTKYTHAPVPNILAHLYHTCWNNARALIDRRPVTKARRRAPPPVPPRARRVSDLNEYLPIPIPGRKPDLT